MYRETILLLSNHKNNNDICFSVVLKRIENRRSSALSELTSKHMFIFEIVVLCWKGFYWIKFVFIKVTRNNLSTEGKGWLYNILFTSYKCAHFQTWQIYLVHAVLNWITLLPHCRLDMLMMMVIKIIITISTISNI